MAGMPEYKKLITRCRALWDAYCKKPTKTNLGKVERHLKRMEGSSSKRVQNELKKARAAVRRELKKRRRRNPMTVNQALEILDLQPGASTAQVSSAYRAAAKKHHPDSGGSPQAMTMINEARRVLKEEGTGDAFRAVPVTRIKKGGPRRPARPAAYRPSTKVRAVRLSPTSRSYEGLDDDEVLMTFRMALQRGGNWEPSRREAIRRGLDMEIEEIEEDFGPRPNPKSKKVVEEYVTVTHPTTGEEIRVKAASVRQVKPSRGRSDTAIFVSGLTQIQIDDAIERHGSLAAAARALGISRKRLKARMEEIEAEVAQKRSAKRASSKKKSRKKKVAKVASSKKKSSKPKPVQVVSRPPGWEPEFIIATKFVEGWDTWRRDADPPENEHVRAGWEARAKTQFVKLSDEGKIIGFERKSKARRLYTTTEVIDMANKYAKRVSKKR